MTHSISYSPCPECGDLDGCHVPARLRDGRGTLADFWDAHALWSQATFGTDAERGPAGPLKHLAKEVAEALVNPHDLEEYADLMLLAFDATRRAGFSYAALVAAMFAKLEKNKQRTWPASSSDEPVEHVR